MIDKPILGEDVYLDPLFADGLVGCWLFNEGSGNKVADLSGNGNYGIINGAIWTPAKHGSGLYFDQAFDYIDLNTANPSIYEGLGSFTFVFLCRSGTSDLSTTAYLANQISTLIIKKDSDDEKFYAYVYLDGSANAGYAKSEAFADTLWHHVVIRYDGKYVKIFVDGVASGSTGGAGNGATVANTNKPYIGKNHASLDWNGDIDHSILYNRALSASEIALLYREPFWGFKQRDSGIYTRI